MVSTYRNQGPPECARSVLQECLPLREHPSQVAIRPYRELGPTSVTSININKRKLCGLAGLTSTVIRVLDDRLTTSRSDIIKLTMIPISTFQMTERVNVMNIIAKSIHAPILVLDLQVRESYLN